MTETTYYKKPMSVVRYDKNGLKYLELLPTTVEGNRAYTDYSEVQDVHPSDNTVQQRGWYTATNARKMNRALPYVAGTLASPVLLVGGIGAAASEALVPTVGKVLNFGMRAMTPSSYTGLFGTGTYNTALGGSGASALGAAADAGLASYYAASAKRAYDDNPNLRHGIELGLAALPAIATSKVVWKARIPRFNPIYESDIPELLKLLDENKFVEKITSDGQKIKMYFPSGNKQPMREDELINLLARYNKRTLSPSEIESAKKAPDIINQFEKEGIKGFTDDFWFQGLDKEITLLDKDIFHSHIPEYYDLYLNLTKSGNLIKKGDTWYGKFSNGMQEVHPEEYIVAHSKAFINSGLKYDGLNRMSAMSKDKYGEFIKNGGLGVTTWTTNNPDQGVVFLNEREPGRLVQNLVSTDAPLVKISTENAKVGREVEHGILYSPNVNYRQTTGDYMLFGHDMLMKALRGNNGDFNMRNRHYLRNFGVPIILGGSLVGNIRNNN